MSSRSLRACLVPLALCTAVPASAAPVDDAFEWEDGAQIRWLDEDTSEPSRIVNGEETAGFPAVVALGIQSGEGVGVFCSGTLVTDTWVLTAAHCVDALHDYQRQGLAGLVIFGSDLAANEIRHQSPILSATNHPDWTGSLEDGADIAVVQFAQPASDVAPMRLLRCDSDLRRPEVLDYVGFGITGDGRRDSGVKRTADIDFDEVQGDFLISYDPAKNLCSGDSGGAALRRSGDGHVLAGVNSFVFDAVGDGTHCFTGGSGATRVAPFLRWIERETDWLPGDPECGTESPEEGTTEAGPTEETPNEAGPEGEPEVGPSEPEGGGEVPQEEPETGGTDPEEPLQGLPFGCACNAANTPGGLGLFALVGLLGLVRRRR